MKVIELLYAWLHSHDGCSCILCQRTRATIEKLEKAREK